jgi:hypothetical protein
VLDAVRRDLARLDAAAVHTREQFGRLVHAGYHVKQIRA